MLTKRTNILFDEDLYQKATTLALMRKSSVGEIVRHAVEREYDEEALKKQRKAAFDAIVHMRPPVSKKKIDYKALINYGRKY